MSKIKIFLFLFSVLMISFSSTLVYLFAKKQPTSVKEFTKFTTMGDFAFFTHEEKERYFLLTPQQNSADPALFYNSYGSYVRDK